MPKKKSSASSTCFICYEPLNQPTSPCGCRICNPCWSQVIITKIQDSNFLHEIITCPGTKCQKELPIMSLYSKMPKSLRNNIDQVTLSAYFSNTPDIRRCPSQNCDYAGVLEISSYCPGNLKCDACGMTWRDKAHFSRTEKLQESMDHLTKHRNETFSMLWKRFKAKKCPKCQVLVSKTGGCDHLTCTRCRYNFCWICLEKNPSHNKFIHQMETSIKPLIFSALKIIMFCLILYAIYLLPPINSFINSTIMPIGHWIWELVKGPWVSWIFWYFIAFLLASFILDNAMTLYDKFEYKSDYPPISKRWLFVRIIFGFLIAYCLGICYQVMIMGGFFVAVAAVLFVKKLLYREQNTVKT